MSPDSDFRNLAVGAIRDGNAVLNQREFFVDSIVNKCGAVNQLAYPRPFANDTLHPGATTE
jgi:hypothetical protein